MDGVLERIDEDEEQKTDGSAITEGDDVEGAAQAEMQSSAEKGQAYDLGQPPMEAMDDEEAEDENGTMVGDGLTPHQPLRKEDVEEDESLQHTVDARADQVLMEGAADQQMSPALAASASEESQKRRSGGKKK